MPRILDRTQKWVHHKGSRYPRRRQRLFDYVEVPCLTKADLQAAVDSLGNASLINSKTGEFVGIIHPSMLAEYSDFLNISDIAAEDIAAGLFDDNEMIDILNDANKGKEGTWQVNPLGPKT